MFTAVWLPVVKAASVSLREEAEVLKERRTLMREI